MKKLLFLFLVLISLTLVSCTKESPEPLYTPETVPPQERVTTGTRQSLGITFRLYNDFTCEIAEVDPAEYASTTISLPEYYDKYKIVAIDDGVFRETSFSSVELPSGLVRIGDAAFEHSQITRIVLPDSITQIGKSIFASCVHLKEAVLGSGIHAIPDEAFFGCRSLEKITLPEALETIGAEAFGDTPSLKHLTLPEGLEEIGEWAFWNSGLAADSLTLPRSVGAVGKAAFDGTEWLEENKEEWVIVGDGVLLRYNGTASLVTVPDSVRFLSNAFDGKEIATLTLPASLSLACKDALADASVSEILYDGTSEAILALKKAL